MFNAYGDDSVDLATTYHKYRLDEITNATNLIKNSGQSIDLTLITNETGPVMTSLYT